MEDWAEIRRLHRAEGMAIRAIARRLGISKNTVKKALAAHEPPRYRRAPKGSIVDVVEPQIRALLAEFPEMPSTVIMERVGCTRIMNGPWPSTFPRRKESMITQGRSHGHPGAPGQPELKIDLRV